MEKHVHEDILFLVKDFLMDSLYHSVLPFRVWNHLFLCERSNLLVSMCECWTKLCITSKKISNHINNSLFVHMSDFPRQLKEGFSLTEKVPYLYIQILLWEMAVATVKGL